MNFLDLVFGCRHEFGWPITLHDRCYQVCLRCGAEQDYRGPLAAKRKGETMQIHTIDCVQVPVEELEEAQARANGTGKVMYVGWDELLRLWTVSGDRSYMTRACREFVAVAPQHSGQTIEQLTSLVAEKGA